MKQGQWRGAFNKAVPAPTVNLTEFCIQYSRNPKLWDELFQWLQNNDLKALKPGRTPIGKTGLVASVEDGTNWCSEHDLRNGKGSESHRDNIDFMIVVDGVEGLALIDHDTATPSPTTPRRGALPLRRHTPQAVRDGTQHLLHHVPMRLAHRKIKTGKATRAR